VIPHNGDHVPVIERLFFSVAERSFLLLDRAKMFVQANAIIALAQKLQLQHKTDKTERLEDLKMPSGIGDNMRSAGLRSCSKASA